MTALLEAFHESGVIDISDVLVAQRLTALAGEPDDRVALAVALAVRAVRAGSVCVNLVALPAQLELPDLPWPAVEEWMAAVGGSVLAGSPPVVHLEGELLYLDRYWLEERQVAQDVLALSVEKPSAQHQQLTVDIDRVFPVGFEEQRRAAEIALSRGLTIVTGGPGTGKTTTIARLLALLSEQAQVSGKPAPRIALAAPTGKAAARLQQAVQHEVSSLDSADRGRLGTLQATTLHRLLRPRPGNSSRFNFHRENRLPYDVIVVDETSMVSLTMMARLMEAVRPHARLLLVGDPDQLASVEAGAVLADLVEGLSDSPASPVARLRTSHRFGQSIGDFAGAIRDGDSERAIELLREGTSAIEWVDTDEPRRQLRTPLVAQAMRLREAAILGDCASAAAILDEHRFLCAHRRGPYGVEHWNRQVERWLSEDTEMPQWTSWYAGRPVLATANDYGLGLYNGDTGVTVLRDGALRVVFGAQEFAPSRLAELETMHAMTIHKSQGSQAAEVTILLPPEDSRLLTRELLYTAVTRAQRKVRLVGSESQLRAALARRAVRASGLRLRLGSTSS